MLSICHHQHYHRRHHHHHHHLITNNINILPLGAAFIGIAPHIAYKQFLESLCGNGYIIVATPYEVDTDFLSICDSILAEFDQLMQDIYKEYQLVDEVKKHLM